MKKIVVLLLFLFLSPVSTARGAPTSIPEDYNLDELQQTFDTLVGKDVSFSFKEYFENVLEGKEMFSFDTIVSKGIHILTSQWGEQKGKLFKLVLLGVLAGLFTNFSDALGRKELGETGFFIVYIILFTTLTVAFFSVVQMTKDVLEGLLTYMQVLIPTLTLTLAASVGTSTSYGFYQITLIGMLLVEFVLLKILVPAVSIYFMIGMANQLTDDRKFSKMAELVHSFLKWSTKALFGFVLGLQGIQMLLLPIMDQVKRNLVLKTAGGLPGVGNTLHSVAETVLGTTMLLKSVIGVGGVIGVCLVCAYPLIKIFVFMVTYRISAAIVQPISDKRVVGSLYITSEGSKILLSIVFTSSLMFLFSIAIVTGITGR